MALLSLAHNVGLLVTLVVLHRILTRRWPQGGLAMQVLAGALYGGIGVLGMVSPIRFTPGVIFDPRSVVLVIGGMFGGPVVGGIAAAMCAAYRIHLGGGGALGGVCVVASSAAIGIAGYYVRRRVPGLSRPLPMLGIGVVAHAAMLAILWLLLPSDAAAAMVRQLSAVILIVYPLATLAVGSIVVDGEERVAQHHALLRSEARYRTVFDEMAQGVVYHDASGSVREANRAAELILGLTRDELLGRAPRDPRRQAEHEDGTPFRAEDHPSMVALRTGREVRDVLMCIHDPRRGGRRWIAISAVPLFGDAGGTPNGVFATFTDLTDLRRAEEDYRTLFRQMLEGFVVQEMIRGQDGAVEDYRFLAANPAFERIVGIAPGELAGKTARQAFPDEGPRWLSHYAAVADTGEPVHFEGRAGPHGCPCEVTAFRPAPGRVACVVDDVTARREAEAERAALQAQLQQAQRLQGLGVLAGGIAHDFNNILAAILGFSEMALGEVPAGSAPARRLEQVLAAANRASDLVRQILAFGRRAAMHRVAVDLAESVREALRFMRATLPATIAIEEHLDEAVPPVLADRTQIHQVLVNLCANAGHAMRARGGTLTVRVYERDGPPAVPSQERPGEPGRYACIEVCDTGEGMDAATLERAFEPFFTTKGAGEGTGLGLAVCHGIVASHGGAIDAESAVGGGTTVRFCLPCTDEPVAEAPRTTPVIAAGSGVVLLVDDEPGVREVGEGLLQALGYTPIGVASASDALELLREPRERAVGILLTDLTMPGLGGIDLARAVREFDRALPIVIATGDSRAVTPEQIAELGIAGVLAKPYTRAELAEALARAPGREAAGG